MKSSNFLTLSFFFHFKTTQILSRSLVLFCRVIARNYFGYGYCILYILKLYIILLFVWSRPLHSALLHFFLLPLVSPNNTLFSPHPLLQYHTIYTHQKKNKTKQNKTKQKQQQPSPLPTGPTHTM